MKNGYVTAEQLQSLSGKRCHRDVEIPNPFSDGVLKFRLRSITEAEWSEISASNFDMRRGGLSSDGLKMSDARLLALCLVDGEGNPLMPGPSGYKQVLSLGTPIAEPLLRAARELCGLRELENTEKNYIAGSDLDTSTPGS